ncbi:hypothetical protein AB6A40_008779 [Gnathostoma spinigerum]|uniref:Uncharacterized protein n=1 Tax=Gnathostoma spinigerum TaxID=75299 RepID=A0ABD6EQ27_9BILA
MINENNGTIQRSSSTISSVMDEDLSLNEKLNNTNSTQLVEIMDDVIASSVTDLSNSSEPFHETAETTLGKLRRTRGQREKIHKTPWLWPLVVTSAIVYSVTVIVAVAIYIFKDY